MLRGLKETFLHSRLWLSSGAVLMVVSLLLGYHQAQMAAETALAQKTSVPNLVFVQDFKGFADENALGEVHVLAEAAFDRAVRATVGKDAQRLVDIVPIFPVSRQSYSKVKSLGDTQRRPAPRSQAAVISKRYDAMARIESMPVGVAVFQATETSTLPDVSHLILGEGRNGALMNLTGLHICGAEVLEVAAAPLAQMGVVLTQEALAIAPYVDGRAIGPASARDTSNLQNTLFWVSLGMLAFGLIAMSTAQSPTKNQSKNMAHQVKATGAFPAMDPFQPIAGQDEIGEDQDAVVTQKASLLKTLISKFRSKSRQ